APNAPEGASGKRKPRSIDPVLRPSIRSFSAPCICAKTCIESLRGDVGAGGGRGFDRTGARSFRETYRVACTGCDAAFARRRNVLPTTSRRGECTHRARL